MASDQLARIFPGPIHSLESFDKLNRYVLCVCSRQTAAASEVSVLQRGTCDLRPFPV